MALLSKSLYTRGLQCEKSLWLKKYREDVLSPPSDDLESRLENGNSIGKLACELFTGGKRVSLEKDNIAEMVTQTKKYLQCGIETIYEATFEKDGVYVMVDILHVNTQGNLELYEVKSSSWNSKKKLKELSHYIDDLSIQHYVVSKCGYSVEKSSLILLNTDYIRGKELDIEQLFSKVDVTKSVEALQKNISSNIQSFSQTLLDTENEPDCDIGWHCKHPYECDALDYCWNRQKKIPSYSVFNIFTLTKESKALELYNQGIIKIEDIPKDFALTQVQEALVSSWVENKAIIKREEVQKFLDTLAYPLCHLDFETYSPSIPEFEGTKAFEQIPFQYSLHIEHENGELEHREFLAKEGSDPRESLVAQILKDIPKGVTTLAYHASFEKGVIQRLAQVFPKKSEHLFALVDNIVDLEKPFSQRHYYLPQMQGKSSIKVILPILVPQMQKAYKELELIQNGGDAMSAFPKLVSLDEKEKEKYRKALLAYCKLDTLAMVKVLAELRKV